MPMTIHMPALSPTMEAGQIAKWHKKEGEKVESGDVLCEIVTDKSTVEFEALDEGYLAKIVIPEGGTARINQGIGILTESAGEDISNYQLEEPNLEPEKVPSVEEGEPAEGGEKAPKAPAQTNMVGMPSMAFEPSPPKKGYKFPKKQGDSHVSASPLAKKLAKEKGLDLASVKGSGPHGRVLAKDLEFAQSSGLISFGVANEPNIPPGTYEEEPLSNMRQVIGERLQASKMMIPHYYIHEVVKADRMMDLRVQLKEMGVKLTFNDFVLKACSLALKKHPVINSGFNSANQTMIRFKTVDISMAVTIPDGLITPIINHADCKDIVQISTEAKELAKRAKEGKLKPEEYQGGSFTISNLGMFGIDSFNAVINPPQAAILAIGGIKEQAVSEKGKIFTGHTMKITLSLDHRVIDGAEGASFLHTVKRLLEHPASLIA